MSKLLFLIDESLSPVLAERLTGLGYNAKAVRDVGLRGAEDTKIIEWAIGNNAVIIAGDKDFGELWYWIYRGEVGVIILRLKSYKAESQYKVIKFLSDNNVLSNSKIGHSLIISTFSRYRLRTK